MRGMSTLPELAAGLAENVTNALREIATHLNHDQITGTLSALADDCEGIAELLREGVALVDEIDFVDRGYVDREDSARTRPEDAAIATPPRGRRASTAAAEG